MLTHVSTVLAVFLTLGISATGFSQEKARRALDEPSRGKFKETRLTTAVARLGDSHDVQIQFAVEVKEEFRASKITRVCPGPTLRDNLRLILSPFGLGFEAAGDRIIIGPLKMK